MLRKTTLSLLVLINGCSLLGEPSSIGELRADGNSLTDIPLPKVRHEDVRKEYQALLGIVDDPELQEHIKRRIAGVYMLEGDYNQLSGAMPGSDGYFSGAIEAYHDVIRQYPEDPDNAEAMYQLAKAYDLDGRDREALDILKDFIRTYPDSRRLTEAWFRKGDIHFRHEEYALAENAYQSVISMGGESAFLNNSWYLLGWSRYKLSEYDSGLVAFSEVLDRLVPADGKIEALDNVSRSLVDDTLRIMSVSLAHAGGSAKIDSMFATRPEASKYTWMLYSRLGEHYLEKERYEDSASSFRAFVSRNPDSDRAPEMHAEMIRAYVDGEFNSQVLPEKERYVASYGITSSFWQEKPRAIRAEVIPHLKQYIDELSRHYHATGQRLKKKAQELDESNPEYQAAMDGSRDSFLQAAGYYGEFVQTFPEDPRVPEMVYMRAEASYDGGNYVAAIDGYEKTAYEYRSPERAADAGYAALVSYQLQSDRLASRHGEASPELTEWRSSAVDSQLRFVRNFRNDKRSASVLARASEELFALKRYPKALEVATGVVTREGEVEQKLYRTAYGVIAHSQYELGQYAKAEQGYRDQLRYMDAGSDEHDKVYERMAATIYKQGEVALKAGSREEAIEQFLRVKQVAPESSIRVVAQFDAASELMVMENWRAALDELREMRDAFPGHELAAQLPEKIAYAYEQDGQWRNAAREYYAIYGGSPDPNVRREALFLAAELSEKAGDPDKAIAHFKTWAREYEQPFDTRMEARYHLAYLYKDKGDFKRHLYWLRRIIGGHEEAGGNQTGRSTWLAAWANAEYGDYWRMEFDRVALRAPLDKSIPRKNEKLKNALERYQNAASYGVLEITTRATWNIGDLYARFARELMDSPRPAGLSDLELAQYEIILQEQAMPFEDMAIDIHKSNIERSWIGEFNEWVQKSFVAMAALSPARFNKQEVQVAYGDGIR